MNNIQEHRAFEHRSFIVRSSRIPEASRHFAAKLRKVSQGLRKLSGIFLTAYGPRAGPGKETSTGEGIPTPQHVPQAAVAGRVGGVVVRAQQDVAGDVPPPELPEESRRPSGLRDMVLSQPSGHTAQKQTNNPKHKVEKNGLPPIKQ